jgi:hypothetical protein
MCECSVRAWLCVSVTAKPRTHLQAVGWGVTGPQVTTNPAEEVQPRHMAQDVSLGWSERSCLEGSEMHSWLASSQHAAAVKPSGGLAPSSGCWVRVGRGCRWSSGHSAKGMLMRAPEAGASTWRWCLQRIWQPTQNLFTKISIFARLQIRPFQLSNKQTWSTTLCKEPPGFHWNSEPFLLHTSI